MEISTPETPRKRPSDPSSLLFYKLTGENKYPRYEPVWLGYTRTKNNNRPTNYKWSKK